MTAPSPSIAGPSFRLASTAGFGPGGVGGMSRWTTMAPPSSCTSRTVNWRSDPGTTAAGCADGFTRPAQAANPRNRHTARRDLIGPTLEERPRPTPTIVPPAAARVLLATLTILAVAASCTPRPLLERAIDARGGALRSFVRASDVDVEAMFPGAWQWRMAYLAPDRYAWSIVTTGGVDHYLFDGQVVRAFVGGRLVASNATPGSPLRTQARFIAVTNLDLGAGASVVPLPASEVPSGVASGLAVVLAGARYRLGFDDRDLLVWATGPFQVPQIGRGELTARYDDFRRVGRLLLPFRIRYDLDGRSLAVERVARLCPDDPALVPASFESPERLPACNGPDGAHASPGSSSTSTRMFQSFASQSRIRDSRTSTASPIAVSSAVP